MEDFLHIGQSGFPRHERTVARSTCPDDECHERTAARLRAEGEEQLRNALVRGLAFVLLFMALK